MSKQVDERVLSMQFDNQRFEKNVQTSMNTLDKLKEKLNLSGASKGLENVQSAAKKVDMSGLAKNIETVRTKFSALEVMGVTALANITNSAVNAGKRMISALTIAPVGDGFKEYEMMLNAVQTTMAGTGKTAEEVEEQLKKLDEYADKTVYSTADMLNNLPKFTNAGVELETATTAMIGIANATALAGGDASKASIAFYNLGQAIGTGYLTRMDYNSINNAGIATMEWKNQMVDAAIAAGTLTKAGEGLYETGGKTFTLQQLFIDGLQHQWATTDVMLKVFGDYGDETTEIGKKSYSAAQDIKTFTQMIESLKATAGTGWKDTWQLIFGDLAEAKNLWTGLTNYISGVINKMADWRNRLLEITFNISSPWSNIKKKLEGSGLGEIKKVVDTVGNAADKLKYFQKVVDKVWNGDYNNRGDNPDRYDLLDKAGYDHRVVQDLVNKGYDYKLTINDIEASHKKFGLSMDKTSEKTKEVTKSIDTLTEEQLRNAGLTEDEISLYKALTKEADKLGISVEELVKNMSEKDGRFLFIDSLKNAWDGISGIFTAMKNAWKEIFNPPGLEELGVKLYGVLTTLNKFSESLRLTDKETGQLNENGEKIKRTFKGIFALIDIVATIVGGPLKIAFKLITQLLGAFDLNILDVTSVIGDAIVKLRDWVDSIFDFSGIFKWIAPYVEKAAEAVRNWFAAVQPLKKVTDIFRKVTDAISDFAKKVYNSDIVQNIISGFTSGLKSGAIKVWEAIKNLAKGIIDTVKNILGIHSPSTEFKEIGINVIEGLINGLKTGITTIVTVAKDLCSRLFGAFTNMDWSKVSDIFYNIYRLFPQLKIFNVISAAGNIVKASGKDVTQGLANGIGQGASAVWDAITGIANGLIETFKSILGIHSPSKVMFAIGGFLIAGLIGGLMGGTTDIKSALKSLASNIAEFFSNLDIGNVIAIGSIVAGLLLVKKVLDIASDFASAAKGVGKLTTSLGKFVDTINNGLLGKFQKSKWDQISDGILKLAIAVGILVAAVVIMTRIDGDKLLKAILALGGIILAVGLLAGIMVGLMYATKVLSGGAGIDAISNTLFKVAAVTLVMVLVAKTAAKMTVGELVQGALAIAAFSSIIVGLMAATKLITGSKNVDKIGGTLLKIAVAIGIMMLVAKMAAKMTIEELVQGGLAMVAFSGIMVGLMAATKLISGSKNVAKIGGALLKIAVAIGIMMLVAKMAAKMSVEELIQGGLAMVAFSGIMVGLMAATKLICGSKNVDKIGGTLFKIAAAIAVMMIVAKIAASMTVEELVQGTLAIVAFSGIIVGLMAATKLIGGSKNIDKMGAAIFKIAVAIGIMALVAKLAASMTVAELIQGTLAIAAFSGIIVGLMAATKLICGSKNIDKMGNALIKIAIVIGVMAASVALLSLIKPERLAVATVAMGALMGMLAVVLKSSKNLTKAMGSLIMMTAIIVAIAGAIFWVGQLPVENALASAGALSILMLTLSASLLIVSKVGKFAKDAVLGVLALTAMAVPLLAFVGVLALMQNVQNAITNAIALALLATVMSLLLIPLTLVGTLAMTGAPFLGVLALLTMAVPLVAFVGVLALMQNVQNATENANLLITMMTAMTKILVVLAIVGPLALIGVSAMAALVTLIAAIGLFATGIGALMEKFPALQSFLDTGLAVLIQVAGGIGEMIGAFVGGIMTQIASSLPAIGLALSEFMMNVTPFIMGCKLVDETVLKGVGILAASVIALTAADLIAGIASFLQGGSSFATLGTELSMFMTNAMPFIMGAKMIDPTIMEGVKTLTEAILILTGANLIESITKFIGGESSLATFGSQLGGLGANLNQFVTNIGTFTDAQVTTVDCAGRAIKALAESAKEIPNEGGWLGSILGENSLASFGDKLPDLGTNLAGFITNLGTFGEDKVTTVDCAGRAIKALAEAASELPNEGGWAAAICGDNSLASFGNKLPDLGTDLAGFITNLGTFGEDSIATVDCAGRAIKALAEAAKTIPNEGGFWAKIVGDNSLADFGNKLPDLGTDIASFVSKLGKFGESQIATVNSACKAIKAIANLGKIDLASTSSGITSVGGVLGGFAEKIKSFVDKMSEIGSDNISSAITKVKDLISLAKTAAGTSIESLKTFGSSLKKIASEGVKGFVKEFTKDTPKNDVKKAAKAIMDAFVKAVKSKKDNAKKQGKAVAEAVTKAMDAKGIIEDAKSAGKNVVTGFANGIKNNKSLASDAGTSLGRAALAAAKAALDEHSPSKEMYKVGDFAGIGFVNALYDYVNKAYRAGTEMGNSVKSGLSSTIARIADTINSDIDAQPTIRPVLDLSDVRAGAGSINGLFTGRTLAVNLAGVGSVSASMANRQNGNGSSEIVSSIKALRKDIANMPRESVNINGITYSGDSEINDAIKVIVRATKMEGRS